MTADDDASVIKIWARRHRDLSRAHNRIACRLHAVLCELVPGGFGKEITAGQATAALAAITPRGATDTARLELAYELLDELRTVAEQRRATKNRITRIVAASKTSITDIYGVGPIVAATVLGDVGDITRFPTRDRFAAYNGTAPIDVSSGNNNVQRLSRRGNRHLNHALHMAALSQIRYPDTVGRDLLRPQDRRGHETQVRAPRAETQDQRHHLRPPRRRRTTHSTIRTREGNRGTTLSPARPAHTPNNQLFGQATPGSPQSLRPQLRPVSRRSRNDRRPALDTKEASIGAQGVSHSHCADRSLSGRVLFGCNRAAPRTSNTLLACRLRLKVCLQHGHLLEVTRGHLKMCVRSVFIDGSSGRVADAVAADSEQVGYRIKSERVG